MTTHPLTSIQSLCADRACLSVDEWQQPDWRADLQVAGVDQGIDGGSDEGTVSWCCPEQPGQIF